MSKLLLINSNVEIMRRTSYHYDMHDEFTQHIYTRTPGEPESLTTLFMHQVMIDIQRTMSNQLDAGLNELQSRRDRTKQVAHQESCKPDMIHLEEIMGNILDEAEIEVILHENIMSAGFVRRRARLRAPRRVSFQLLKSYPLLCGLILFRWRLKYQEAGLDIADRDAAVHDCVHLCNVYNQGGIHDKDWSDIDYVMEHHALSDFFVGQIPQSLNQMGKQWIAVNGVSQTLYSKETLLT